MRVNVCVFLAQAPCSHGEEGGRGSKRAVSESAGCIGGGAAAAAVRGYSRGCEKVDERQEMSLKCFESVMIVIKSVIIGFFL